MKDYWLAKLINSVPKVDSRKRLQKSIYLLQFRKNFPLKFDYFLHYYGPYSFELASAIDQLKAADIINENPEQTGFGSIRYKSQITEKGKRVLEDFQKSDEGKKANRKISPFIHLFEQLNEKNLWVLELAATIAYYHEGNWPRAQDQTAKFKKITVDDFNLKQAVKIAKDFKN
ncbi:MAG: hypothetical protein OEV45_11620 [Desulfobacteraceae bacterium]|nr:hypothetical protein [Desulfobacteraceae bacterium]